MGTLLTDTKKIIRDICRKLDIPSDMCSYLSIPTQTAVASLPVTLENGDIRMVEAYRVLHSTSLGPGKGGLMIDKYITKEDCQAMALRMTLKCSLMDIPLGGASGLIKANPEEFSRAELIHLVRRYTSDFINLIGPEKDIIGPDLNAGPDLMSIVMDTYSMDTGCTSHRVCTGKPIELGGIIGREKAMGLGLGFLMHELARTKFEEISGQNIVIQGIGMVGKNVARSTDEMGAKLIAISDSQTGIYDPNGIDVEHIIKYKKDQGTLRGYPKGKEITNEELLRLKCDLLIPCAIHNQINEYNVHHLQCRRIIEGANGALSKEANDVLWERNILVVPDILANAGGLIVSYLEWVQNFQQLTWDLQDVMNELQRILVPVFHKVHHYAVSNNVSYRTAAYSIAITKLQKCGEIRGIFP